MSKSDAEKTLFLQLKAGQIEPVTEYKFHDVRRWRFDFAYPSLMIGIEVEGITKYGKNKNGTMKLGRHQTAKGMENDLQKYNEAMRMGWNIYRCSPDMVMSGQALETIQTLYSMAREREYGTQQNG